MSTQQEQKSDPSLLTLLEGTESGALATAVAKQEGVLNGGTLEPVYSARKMRCFTVTNSELNQIGFINTLSTFSIGAGSLFLGICIDLNLEGLKAPIAGDSTLAVFYAKWASGIFAGLFYVGAVIAAHWRRKFINTIKLESGDGK